ncbi:hypothetical protein SCP_0207220 [Sparassis crispa]|uniref:Retrotransposon gag domain-containing protein n=1 Tax=Sparassis crispa TaxID=139825 RepID=A0A401GBJ0_9APHY|nr:hypothetical protein SCP_0207220 [Sparassis crispa]GBE79522.1 hypothetical protein SCP_0207220 [Sparassis crispa]
MQQPQATPSVPTIHFREPRIFNGKPEEVVPFLKEIRHAVQLQHWGLPTQEYDKVVYMATYLKDGSPALWFNSIEQFNLALLQDWDGFLDTFRECFEDPDLVTKNLHQTSLVASYSSHFKELLVYLDFSDQTKIQYFRRNLKELVKDLFLTIQPSTNFKDFITQAIALDNCLHQHELEKKSDKFFPHHIPSHASEGQHRPREHMQLQLAASTSNNDVVPMEVDVV